MDGISKKPDGITHNPARKMNGSEEQEQPSKCGCSRSEKVDRRDFLKAAAMAGLLAGCSPALETLAPTDAPTSTPKPTLKPGETAMPDFNGKKALYILPRGQYASVCHEASATILKECGMSIVLAAIEKKEIPGFAADVPVLTPDLLLSEVRVEDYDAVIFECGQPQETYNTDYQNLAKEAAAQNKVLGAICMMPTILAAAGLLKGKQATSNTVDQYALEQFGAVLAEGNAVCDGKIVTASFEGSGQFGWLIVEALSG